MKDIHAALLEILNRYQIEIKDITCITSDGAASMIGVRNGVVAKLKEANPKLISLQCIIHQENLVAKAGIPEAVFFADKVMKIVNKCISSGATRHRLFRKFLEDCESDMNDLVKMQQVRWLSCASVFAKFLSGIEAIKQFLQSVNLEFEELNDNLWIQKLAFLSDLTGKMATLNKNLQGKEHYAWSSFKEILSFKLDIESSISEFENDDFGSYPNLEKCSESIDKNTFLGWLKCILSDISTRFKDFSEIMFILRFGENPGGATNADLKMIADQFELDYQRLKLDMNKYRSDLELGKDDSLTKFYKYRYLSLAMAHCKSIFADSYLCESAFSKMNFILSDYRSRLTQEHLEACLLISLSELQIDFDYLVSKLDCRVLK